MIYLLLLFILTPLLVLGTGYLKTDSGRKLPIYTPFYFIVFISLIIFAGIRYDVGIDYETYLKSYECKWYESNNTEPLFAFINHFSNNLGFEFWAVTLIIAFIQFVFLFLSVGPVPKAYKWVPIFLFIVNGDLFYSFNILRQSIAIMIMLYFIRFIYERKFLRYILGVCIASLFHYTAIPLVFLYFFAHIRLKRRWLLGIYLFSFVVWKLNLVNQAFYFIISFLPKYSEYIATSFIDTLKLGSGLGFAFRQSIGLLIICNYNRLRNDDHSVLYVNLFLLSCFFGLAFFNLGILDRFNDYFKIFIIFAIPFTINAFKVRFNRYFLTIIVCVLFTLLFAKTSLTSKKNEKLHYKTIFDDN